MPDRLPPPEEFRDRLDVYLGRHGPSVPSVYRFLLAFTLAALLSLPLVRVSLTVAAPGLLRPAIERHEIRVAGGGIVERVSASVGDRLHAGDPLAVIGNEPLRRRAMELARRIERGTTQQVDLQHAVTAVESGDAGPTFGTREIATEWARLAAELEDRRIRVDQAAAELERSAALARSGLVSVAEAEDARTRLAAERAAEALAIANQLAAWRSRQGALETELGQWNSERAEIVERIAASTIRSPVDGTVSELLAISPGSVVVSGERLATISPDETLVAETWVSPADIGSVHPGLPVRLHVDAFNFSDWGALEGRVESISDDFVALDDRAVFRVLVRVENPELRLPDGAIAELRKGMTVRAHFVLARRSLLQLLRDRASDRMDPRRAPVAIAG